MKSLKKFISRDVACHVCTPMVARHVCTFVARHGCTSMVAAMFLFPACSDFLDVVPDKNMTIETVFSRKEEAYNALAAAYSYMPNDSKRQSRWLLGDEWVNAQWNTDNAQWQPIRVMERLMMPDNPYLGTWSGTQGGKNLYEGISMCNTFIAHIDKVGDMTDLEKADWKAQVKFLKAYYHFLLLQQYGPVVIMDKEISPDDPLEVMTGVRSNIDECFKYIVETMGEAIPNLVLRQQGIFLGQIDRLGATAIKARVLLYRASPFYSGNTDYTNFYDHNHELFFPQDDAATTKAKWQDALTAINDAITLCTTNGIGMYTYQKKALPDDQEDFDINSRMQTLYDLRNLITDQWNKEQIWMGSNVVQNDADIFTDGNIMLTAAFALYGVVSAAYCRQELGATYKTLERYYTRNGLPLNEDVSFDDKTKFDIIKTPAPADPNFDEYRGILQTNVDIIKLYMDRELRFYANVGITGGYWRAYSTRLPTTFFFNELGGRRGSPADNHFWTGIGAQKQIHWDSKAGYIQGVVAVPTPIIRLADLYLMKAEALNETLDKPDQEVWDAINIVRLRAGIPTVEAAYTGSSVTTAAFEKHLTKTGMRAIVAHERKVEFAFEGHIFWDMIRTKHAIDEFNAPVTGWNVTGANAKDFFNLSVKQQRRFNLRDCLWPLPTEELNKNTELIQNPGW
ncbi:RagB/SusD domain-containing protein [Candidatus Symbiothrix dinenymphae]|nr:RagB/SusD domain-containing protein [Candidatus Symbiothrix dinenymphae]